MEGTLTLSRVADVMDTDLQGHGARTAELSTRIGREMALDAETLRRLHLGAVLHDVGKIGVDQEVLLLPRGLTTNERSEVERHPLVGFELLKDLVHPDIAEAVLYHHERIDGLGYPYGISGMEIPLLARIISVADAADAIVSERVYKPAWTWNTALRELWIHSGTQFDPTIVSVATAILAKQMDDEPLDLEPIVA